MPSNASLAPSADAPTYDASARRFHWRVVALVACQFVTALLLPHIEVDTPLDKTINLHFNIGLAKLAVMAARLVHRLALPASVAPGESTRRERVLASAMASAVLCGLVGWPVPRLGRGLCAPRAGEVTRDRHAAGACASKGAMRIRGR